MDNKVKKLIDRIRADLEKVGELTGKNHISAYVINDFYSFRAIKDGDENDKPIDINKIGDKEV